jgi:hypothetical protein
MIPHVLTSQSLTVFLNGRPVCLPATHANFNAAVACVANDDPVTLESLLNVKQSISNFTRGRIEVNDNVLTYQGRELNTSLARKIIEFLREGNPALAEPLIAFLDKVMGNPSFRAVEGLYDWVAASGMPITPEGEILAWKIVDGNFMDYRTRSFDHTPGKVVTQPRNQCDEDPDQTCSYGIHFCSFDYLPHYFSGDSTRRIVLVKIHPADVVAIPRDYNNAKGRCCQLTVLEEVDPEYVKDFFPTSTVYAQTKFEVGQKWRDNDGDVHTVTRVEWPNVYTDLGGDEWIFDFEGVDEDIELVEQVLFEFELGQLYLCRDGKVREVTHISDRGDIVYLEHSCVWANTGMCNRHIESGMDVLELIEAFPLQVGQVWLDKDGVERTITRVDECDWRDDDSWIAILGEYNSVWAHNGSSDHATPPGKGRLVRLVSVPR